MSNEYIAKTEDVVLECGKKVTVKSMTIEWWFYFLLPKLREISAAKVLPETKQEIVAEVASGNITQETLGKMPLPLLEILIEIVVYFVGEGRDWCLKNITLLDFALILNTFLKLSDAKQLLDFFVKIDQQIPIGIPINAAMLMTTMRKP